MAHRPAHTIPLPQWRPKQSPAACRDAGDGNRVTPRDPAQIQAENDHKALVILEQRVRDSLLSRTTAHKGEERILKDAFKAFVSRSLFLSARSLQSSQAGRT